MFKYFPFFSKLRAFARFGIFTLTFTSATAGIGAAFFLSKLKRNWQTYAAVLILALAIFDFYPGPFPVLSEVQARPVDYWLAEQPGEGALIQFPFWMGEDQNQIYNTLIHQKPYVGGFFNAFPPRQYQIVYRSWKTSLMKKVLACSRNWVYSMFWWMWMNMKTLNGCAANVKEWV